MPTETIIVVAIFSVGIGVFLMDFFVRREAMQYIKDVHMDIEELEKEYKSVLRKINDVDTQRAGKMLELQDRLEKLDLSMKLWTKK